MIQVVLPNNCKAERQYAVSILLEEWLGLPVEIHFEETFFSAEIKLENGNRLLLEDHFFHHFSDGEGNYLRRENLPKAPVFLIKMNNPFLPENDLPLVFGSQKMEISNREITCGADLFASAFFMLTRWEEYVCPDRDIHQRFPAKASIAYRYGFLHRPVVNEYGEMLWNMLIYLGIRQQRKQLQFESIITHDVDYPLLWNTPWSPVKKFSGSLLKRRNLKEGLYYWKNYFQTLRGKANDPFDTFDYLMSQAEANKCKAHFFFLCGGKHRFDNPFSFPLPFVRDLIKEVSARGHYIGVHPSYDSYNQPELFRTELQRMENLCGHRITTGRQHFLRFEAPRTWEIWEENQMDWSSTVYYAESAGFRCGTCIPFSVFNFLTRQPYKLKELPLTLMEGTYINYQKLSPDKMWEAMENTVKTVKKYRGCFVLLWHNSMINLPEWKPYKKVYERFFELIQ